MTKSTTNLDPVTTAIQRKNIRKLRRAGWEDLVRESPVSHIETVVGTEFRDMHDITRKVVDETMMSVAKARLIQGIRRKRVCILSADIAPTVVVAIVESLANVVGSGVWSRVPPAAIDAVPTTL